MFLKVVYYDLLSANLNNVPQRWVFYLVLVRSGTYCKSYTPNR